jgi:hypothetical protein
MSTHPNSLKNLKPFFNKEKAQSAQKNSVISRKANAAAREELKMSMRDWKLFKTDVLAEADMSSIDVLKVLMHKALLMKSLIENSESLYRSINRKPVSFFCRLPKNKIP